LVHGADPLHTLKTMNNELKVGARSKPYVTLDGDKPVIVIDEIQYDASYDTYYKIQVMVNSNPTSAEIFKVKLANPNE